MRLRIHFRAGLRPAIGLLACLGCGSGDELPRESISGTVTLEGKPLASGFITFSPTAGQPTQSGGVIADGAFSVPRDQGPVPGPYSISIKAGATEAKLSPDEEATGMPGHVPPQPIDPIPARYNSKTTLSAEVEEGGDNHFSFALEGGPAESTSKAARSKSPRKS